MPLSRVRLVSSLVSSFTMTYAALRAAVFVLVDFAMAPCSSTLGSVRCSQILRVLSEATRLGMCALVTCKRALRISTVGSCFRRFAKSLRRFMVGTCVFS